MPAPRPLLLSAACLLAVSLAAAAATTWAAPTPAKPKAPVRPVSYNRDIRPILADNCFGCHGADLNKAEGGLSLMDFEHATHPHKGKPPAIVPGKPKESELVGRIWDKDDPMPPVDSHKTLTQKQKDLLTQWIQEGGKYEKHWAYELPKPTPTPEVAGKAWPLSFADNYILARLESEGLAPAPEADRATLCRRLYQDLLGLPPTPAQMDAFLADKRPEAYEKLVDELLASPHHAERMATYWLDLVRYSDSVGLHGDQEHKAAPYRDWVIASFMKNMKHDQFIQWQLGGDLVEGLGEEDRNDALIASCYNRLIMTTHEGGAQLKEYAAIYQADRVRNTSLAFMGGSMGCCQCHDHKYDPYTLTDFYSLTALFADIDDLGHLRNQYRGENNREVTLREPEMNLLSPLDRLRQGAMAAQLAAMGPAAAGPGKSIARGRFILLRQNNPENHFSIAEIQVMAKGENLALRPATKAFGSGSIYQPVNTPDKVKDGLALLQKDNDLTGVFVANPGPNNWVELDLGAETEIDEIRVLGRNDTYAFQSGDYTVYVGKDDFQGHVDDLAATERAASWKQARGAVEENTHSAITLGHAGSRATLEAAIHAIKPRAVMVSKASAPRETRVLPRGNWMDDSGAIVAPEVPKFLGSFAKLGVKDRRANRLDFGRWLTAPNDTGGCGELTARVWVNRLWYLFHGQGLCPSVDDLGGQGEICTHPELLDRLALEFVKGGWDNRAFIRMLVTSRAYRMSSVPAAEVQEKDPRNLLFARQGRWRLPAEHIRDTALAASGLLVSDIGGPTCRPYQPEGYYQHLQFPDRTYRSDKDAKQWKRGVYMHWQRMFVHPALRAFDAPSREDSCPIRGVTNTPLAALTALNDATFVEAARVLAEMTLKAGLPDDDARARFILRRCLSRPATDAETAAVRQVLGTARKDFAGRPADAARLLSVGLAPLDKSLPPAELAATTQAARVALNLHETLTRD